MTHFAVIRSVVSFSRYFSQFDIRVMVSTSQICIVSLVEMFHTNHKGPCTPIR